jgi:hypothetical protein
MSKFFIFIGVKMILISFRTPSSSCLKTTLNSRPKKNLALSKENMRLPGEVFNANVQCQLKFGPKSHHSNLQSGHEICTDLHCTKDHYTWASHAALEGTTCGVGQVHIQ